MYTEDLCSKYLYVKKQLALNTVNLGKLSKVGRSRGNGLIVVTYKRKVSAKALSQDVISFTRT